MLSTILLIVAVLVLAFVVVVARRPSIFHVERSVTIAAPASQIFPHVNSSRGWEPWSPWIQIEPTATFQYEGPAAGTGAITRFSGKKVGTGTVTVVESRSNDLIRFRLDMEKPFRVSNDVTFTFIRDGSQTIVTWSMSGASNFFTKTMSLFVDCEDMCGRNFAQGLNNLKQIVEASQPQPIEIR